MNTAAMDIDEDAAPQGPIDEGHGGIKRKAGEDAEPTAKKLRMGILTEFYNGSAADTAIVYRTCRCSFEEVKFTDPPLIVQLLTSGRRDRENCMVFVSDLPESATEDDLKALFKDVRDIFTPFRNRINHEPVYLPVRRHSRG